MTQVHNTQDFNKTAFQCFCNNLSFKIIRFQEPSPACILMLNY